MATTARESLLVYPCEDPGPSTEFEELVGTRHIVAKYQKLIYQEKPPESDSSDEPFQFNIPDKKVVRIKAKQEKQKRLVAHRKKLTSREIIQTHRSRFGGCGVFSRVTPHLSEMAVGARSNR